MQPDLTKALAASRLAKARLARRAQARLSEMEVQEVSLVDRAANERFFVFMKRGAMRIPLARKEALMDGLAEALDKLAALATTIGEAEADDAAKEPPELATAFEVLGSAVTALGAPSKDATQKGGFWPADLSAELEKKRRTAAVARR